MPPVAHLLKQLLRSQYRHRTRLPIHAGENAGGGATAGFGSGKRVAFDDGIQLARALLRKRKGFRLR